MHFSIVSTQMNYLVLSSISNLCSLGFVTTLWERFVCTHCLQFLFFCSLLNPLGFNFNLSTLQKVLISSSQLLSAVLNLISVEQGERSSAKSEHGEEMYVRVTQVNRRLNGEEKWPDCSSFVVVHTRLAVMSRCTILSSHPPAWVCQASKTKPGRQERRCKQRSGQEG